MARVNCYLPEYLDARRNELPPRVTLSSILAEGLERELAKLEQPKKRKGSAAA